MGVEISVTAAICYATAMGDNGSFDIQQYWTLGKTNSIPDTFTGSTECIGVWGAL